MDDGANGRPKLRQLDERIILITHYGSTTSWLMMMTTTYKMATSIVEDSSRKLEWEMVLKFRYNWFDIVW